MPILEITRCVMQRNSRVHVLTNLYPCYCCACGNRSVASLVISRTPAVYVCKYSAADESRVALHNTPCYFKNWHLNGRYFAESLFLHYCTGTYLLAQDGLIREFLIKVLCLQLSNGSHNLNENRRTWSRCLCEKNRFMYFLNIR